MGEVTGHCRTADEEEGRCAAAPLDGTDDDKSGADLSRLLERAASLLHGLGEAFSDVAHRLQELTDRLAQGRFHLAVLGQFKRGKSTLLNALLGEAVLPMAVVPLTAVPTFIRPGQTPAARVHFQDERPPE